VDRLQPIIPGRIRRAAQAQRCQWDRLDRDPYPCGGALSGTAARQPNASPAPAPIGSSKSFDGDLAQAQKFAPLLADGAATSLTELAIRYAITEPNVGTALIGLASQSDLETAIGSVEKGPLLRDVLGRVAAIQATLAPSS